MANIKHNVVINIITKNSKKVLDVLSKVKSAGASVLGGGSGGSGTNTATAGIKKTTDAMANHAKVSKGVGQLTANQTKAFSKMEQGMVGGLVPAYATVAANVFALTAAFGALSRAADFQVLIKGAEELSSQTGRSLVSLAGNMQDITDGAISMKEALTSASIAASAGFDNKTKPLESIQELVDLVNESAQVERERKDIEEEVA